VNLAQETMDYETKLKNYRAQIKEKEILNEQMYTKKITEMLDEYDVMKERCD
jgi:hypothetical protein